jgi:hypothetical protein
MSAANDAAQIRGRSKLRVCGGPGSAVHHCVLHRARDKEEVQTCKYARVLDVGPGQALAGFAIPPLAPENRGRAGCLGSCRTHGPRCLATLRLVARKPQVRQNSMASRVRCL